jgi:hypothetical protein
LLAGFVAWVLDGRTAAVPALNRALDAMGSADDFAHVWMAAAAAHDLFRLNLAHRMTKRHPTRAARGFQAVAEALAGPPSDAEARYRDAVELLSITETATHGHRARLLHGEWLRRQDRLPEARAELKAAYDAFTGMGAPFFAARAERELAAVGEQVTRTSRAGAVELTAR